MASKIPNKTNPANDSKVTTGSGSTYKSSTDHFSGQRDSNIESAATGDAAHTGNPTVNQSPDNLGNNKKN